ncbi:MAG TPA: hypothetical protein VFH73_02755 [Polyangia bacterium]|nr:hypothetical protein [Polyangia bacterium]
MRRAPTTAAPGSLEQWARGVLGLLCAASLAGCTGTLPAGVACDAPRFDGRLTLPARDGVAAAPFSLDVDATGSADIRSIAIAGNRGQVSYRGHTVDFLVHERIPYPGTRVLYQAFGSVVDDGRDLHLLWLYCDGERLGTVYYETTSTAGAYVPINGQCRVTEKFVQIPTHLPALDLQVPRLACGFSIDSADGSISLDGAGPGTLMDDLGAPRKALIFNMLDCRNGCDAPELGHSWFELHVLLWDAARPVLDYGILYLLTSGRSNTGTRAILDHGYSLSGVAPMFRTTYDCNWSVP